MASQRHFMVIIQQILAIIWRKPAAREKNKKKREGRKKFVITTFSKAYDDRVTTENRL
jgi:hypothetical protein